MGAAGVLCLQPGQLSLNRHRILSHEKHATGARHGGSRQFRLGPECIVPDAHGPGHAFGIRGIGTDPVTGTITPDGIPEMAGHKGENRV